MNPQFTGDRPWEGTPLLGSWARGEQYLYNILEDLNHWVTGWTDWNLALDLQVMSMHEFYTFNDDNTYKKGLHGQGGPNWVGNFVDAPIIVDAENERFYKNPMWYALGHVSRFAPEGSVRIGTSSGNVPNKISMSAFQRLDGGIVVILLNR